MEWENVLAVKSQQREGESERGARMDEKQTARDWRACEKSFEVYSCMHLLLTTPQYSTEEHLHVCVRGGNTDRETERVQEWDNH